MNCPKCGASEIENGTWPFSYECGSGGDRREKIYHSVICVELCDLRKWREVVLSHVKSVPSMRFSTGEFIACCKIPIGAADVLDAKEAFDAAVRKEMENV